MDNETKGVLRELLRMVWQCAEAIEDMSPEGSCPLCHDQHHVDGQLYTCDRISRLGDAISKISA